jgi:ATP-binding cassette subfamily G (WHITE) protein 2 (SNQ2)
VTYNEEDDVHFASLNVWQTLRFALMHKMPKRNKHRLPIMVNGLLRMFGIAHTAYTLVGDAYLRGISGGERKRVSICESLAGNATVLCWDNSTRGLDASTALDYAKSLRVMIDISNRTTLITLYQVGEDIYNLMNKVIVLHEGRMIYQGPAKEAKQYFIDLGFRCPERQTTADFLTAVTNPIEHTFQPEMEAKAPKSAEELEAAFRNSEAYRKVLENIKDYKTYLQKTELADAKEFKLSVQQTKSKTVLKDSSYTVSFLRNLRACIQREFWLLWVTDLPSIQNCTQLPTSVGVAN